MAPYERDQLGELNVRDAKVLLEKKMIGCSIAREPSLEELGT